MRITLIIGLPGSGKTYFAKTLGGVLVDDPSSLNELPKKCDHLIITDPDFCNKNTLNSCIDILQLMYDDVTIEKIYFDNDPIQCKKNASTRKDKIVDSYINYLSQIYIPDILCKVLPCYKK